MDAQEYLDAIAGAGNKHPCKRSSDRPTHFPHHVHINADDQVEPGQQMSIIEIIQMLEDEMGIHS